MRLLSQVCLVPAVLAALGSATEPVQAQSAFQRIFGLGGGGRQTALRGFGRFRNYGAIGGYGYETQSRSQGGGGYRTVCVRMCDGYYWPVSSNASRSKFYRDAAVCQSSCDQEARLFYLPRASDDVAKMTDLSGRAYGRLPEAFSYRKSLSGECTCKPEPWSMAASLQHRLYAEIEAENIQQAAAEREAARALAHAKSVTNDLASISEAEPEAVANEATVSSSDAGAAPGDPLVDAPMLPDTVIAEAASSPETADSLLGLQQKKIRVQASPPRRVPQYRALRPRYAARGGQSRRGLVTW